MSEPAITCAGCHRLVLISKLEEHYGSDEHKNPAAGSTAAPPDTHTPQTGAPASRKPQLLEKFSDKAMANPTAVLLLWISGILIGWFLHR